MDYTNLVANIRSYTENDFPSTSGTGGLSSDDQIAVFVRQAEQRVFNSVQILDLRRNSTGVLTVDNCYLELPSDWLATFSLAYIDPLTGAYTYLLNKDVNFIREMYPSPTDTGAPAYYALFDKNTAIIGPTPDFGYSVELHYFYYPESIVDAGTSWLGDNFDTVLLYGALIEAYTQMKGEEDIIKLYRSRYEEAFAMLKQLGEGKNRQDMYRTPQARYPVR